MADIRIQNTETGELERILREGDVALLQDAGELSKRFRRELQKGAETITVSVKDIRTMNSILEEADDSVESLSSKLSSSLERLSAMSSTLKESNTDYLALVRSASKAESIERNLVGLMQEGVRYDQQRFSSDRARLAAEKGRVAEIENRLLQRASTQLGVQVKLETEDAKNDHLNQYKKKLQKELGKGGVSDQRKSEIDDELKLIELRHDYYGGLSDRIEEARKNAEKLYKQHTQIGNHLQRGFRVGGYEVFGKLASTVGLKGLATEVQEVVETAKEAGRKAGVEASNDFKNSWKERADGNMVRQVVGKDGTVQEEVASKKEVAVQAVIKQNLAARQAANSVLKSSLGVGNLILKTAGGIGAVLGTVILQSIFKVSTEAANVKREIGQWGIGVATGNAAFASTKDTLVVIQDIVKNIGMNPVTIFTDKELGKMAEAKNILGLTTEQAVGLGIKSKLAGVGADAYRDAIARGNNEVNKYGIAHGQVLDGVLEASDAITLSLGNQPGKIASAVVMAKSLGLELREIENIQQNLLSFESSIENEMKAQLLTGMNINLNKAREYALMNDLEGVAREIKQQGVDMATFGGMNVIQQESLAKALGMNREQLAKSIILQEMQNGLSAEAIAQSMNMTKESVEAMGIQERWTKSVEQLKEAFTPILSILIPIAQIVSSIVSRIGWAIGSLQKLVGIKGYDSPTNRMSDWASGTSGLGYKETSSAKKTNQNAGIESEIAELEKLKRREGDKAKHDELQARINELRSKSTVLQQEVDKIATSGAKIERPVQAGTNILGVLATLTLGFPIVVNGIAGAARMIKAFAGSVVNYYRLAGTRVAALGKTVWSVAKGGNLTGGEKSVGNKVKSKQGKNLGQQAVRSRKGSNVPGSQQEFNGKKLNKVANDISSSEKKLSTVNTKTFDKVAKDISSFFRKLSSVKTAGSSKVATAVSRFFRKLSRVRTAKTSMLPGAATSVKTAASILNGIRTPTGLDKVALRIQSFFSQLHTVKVGKALRIALVSGLLGPGLAALGVAAKILPKTQKMRSAGGAVVAFFQALANGSGVAIKAIPIVALVVGAAIGIGFAAKLLGEGISKVVNSVTSFIPALVEGLKQLSNIEFTKLLGVGASLWLFGVGLTAAMISLVGAFILGRPALLGVSMLSKVLAKLGEIDTSKFSTIKTDLINLGEGVRALSVVEDVKVGRLNRLSKVLARFKGLAGIGAELRSFATGMQALSSIPLGVPEPEKLNLDQVVTASQQVREKSTIQSEDRRKIEAEKANRVIKVEKEESKNTEIDQRILAVLSRIEGTLKNPIRLDWDDREFRMYQASIEYSN